MPADAAVPAERPSAVARSAGPRFSKPARIAVGLLLTLVGLFFLVLLFPTSPSDLARTLPVAAVGIVALWVGGILMGIGSRS